MARARIPASPGFPIKGNNPYHEDEEDDSDSGLLSEKPSDSAWAYQHQRLASIPTWVKELSNPANLPESVRTGASFGARLTRKTIAIAGIICFTAILVWTASHRHDPGPPTPTAAFVDHSSWLSHAKPASRPHDDLMPTTKWRKSSGFQIVGIVFYGRRVHVDILDCYLQQNLIRNGGYLDGVLFFQNTNDRDDIDYLTQLIEHEPRYKRIDFGDDHDNWEHMWDAYFDDSTMYFKIDDDLVYIHQSAIPTMVHTLLDHPEAHNVQANIINSPSTSWQHFHSGAVRAYLPEIVPPHLWVVNRTAWRPSELPSYPAEFAQDVFDIDAPPPFSGHRWLPMEDASVALMKTPIRQTENWAWGRDWAKWGIGAQHHYSLFSNIEEGTMDRYIFGNGEGIFNTQ